MKLEHIPILSALVTGVWLGWTSETFWQLILGWVACAIAVSLLGSVVSTLIFANHWISKEEPSRVSWRDSLWEIGGISVAWGLQQAFFSALISALLFAERQLLG